jgi:hypothetical protein
MNPSSSLVIETHNLSKAYRGNPMHHTCSGDACTDELQPHIRRQK